MKLFKVLSLVVVTATFSNLGALHASSKMVVGEQNQYTSEELYESWLSGLCETDPEKIASNKTLLSSVVSGIHSCEGQLSNTLATAIVVKAETHDDAAYVHAAMLATGRGMKQDMQKAHDKFALLAEKGRADAMNLLGVMYFYGWARADGSRQAPDPEKALELCKKAADSHADAMRNLGTMHASGWQRTDGSKQAPNPEKALEYFKKAADKCNADAKNNIIPIKLIILTL